MSTDWTDIEVELIVADYFSMLYDELKGVPINKTEHRKGLVSLINRSQASLEFKHRNISAELINLGLPFIKGYKPLYNSQKTKLVSKIMDYISINPSVTLVFENFSESVENPLKDPDFNSWIVEKPEISNSIKEPKKSYRRAVKINYLEKEQRNRALGLKGEELVMEYEKWNLLNANKSNLADSVEWMSRDLGDGLGYDILSKNLNGTDKYIEVKTTKLGKEAPFFFTSNELQFSIEQAKNFHLYRIFDFNTSPRMFSINGRYDHFCHMESIMFRGKF